MNADRWQQVKALFHRAVETDPEARAELLREGCGEDLELRREVESLLEFEREPGSVLELPGGTAVHLLSVPINCSMTGRAIGNYCVTGELAHGGMGTVYLARHVTLPRQAVVKCTRLMASSAAARAELQARFRREAHIQCQLDHPNIVRVFEFFADAEEHFLVMEYVPGSSLRAMLDKGRVLPVAEACNLAIQALEGLAHAHSLDYVDEFGNAGLGLIHRFA